MNNETSKKIQIIYDIFISFLAFIVILTVVVDLSVELSTKNQMILNHINEGIWVIFVIDYFIRLVLSKNKKKFICENFIDLIAIIPFEAFFQTLRIVRVLKIIKVFVFYFKCEKYIEKFIKTNNFHHVLKLTIIIVLLGAFGFHFTENKSFGESLWWSFVTATTVGYGDISPVTILGRIIASILMLTGIGFVGMLTSTISTYFIYERHIKKSSDLKSKIITDIKTQLDDFDNISNEDIDSIYHILKELKKQNCNESKI